MPVPIRPTVLLLLGALAVSAGSSASAAARTRPKPIVIDYDVRLVPDPTTGVFVDYPNAGTTTCLRGRLKGDHVRSLRLPAAGSLDVTLSGFTGDWDLCLKDSSGKIRRESATDLMYQSTPPTEHLTFTASRRMTVQIEVLNSAGTPDAHVHSVFRYR